jgi:hypothetical protein
MCLADMASDSAGNDPTLGFSVQVRYIIGQHAIQNPEKTRI